MLSICLEKCSQNMKEFFGHQKKKWHEVKCSTKTAAICPFLYVQRFNRAEAIDIGGQRATLQYLCWAEKIPRKFHIRKGYWISQCLSCLSGVGGHFLLTYNDCSASPFTKHTQHATSPTDFALKKGNACKKCHLKFSKLLCNARRRRTIDNYTE